MKTELRSPWWDGYMLIDMKEVEVGEEFFLNITLARQGNLRGFFRVLDVIPYQDWRGLRQKVVIGPREKADE